MVRAVESNQEMITPQRQGNDESGLIKGGIMQESKNCSREVAKARRNAEELASIVVDCAFHLHSDLGPGLLETVYEAILAKQLEKKGLHVERQKPVPIRYQGVELNEGFRLDILLENELIIELKSVENIHPVHSKQLLTYLRLMDLSLGLLINFGAPLMKEGLHRVVNKHTNFASSRLRVHQDLFLGVTR